MNEKLDGERVAIVGLGGTGSYILDFVAKTRVARSTCSTTTHSSRTTRSGGRAHPGVEELNATPLKVDRFVAMYSLMHRGVVAHPVQVTDTNVDELLSMTFVFLAIDDAAAKRPIVGTLVAAGITFVDVGIGGRGR